MSIPSAFRPTPITPLEWDVPIVDPQTGYATQEFILAYENLRNYVSGSNRVIPCSAVTSSNFITLTPNDNAPLIEGYIDYEIFVFTADASTTAAVTATVVPVTGTLATLNVYASDGGAQAGNGDIVADRVYMLIFADHLNSNAGGLVLK